MFDSLVLYLTWKYFSSIQLSCLFVIWNISLFNDGLSKCSNKGHERIDTRALKRRKVAVNEVIA